MVPPGATTEAIHSTMKILHVTDDLSSLGGIQTYLGQLAVALPGLGFECDMYAPPGGIAPGRGHVSRWHSLRYTRQLRSLVEEWRPEVVHAHSVSMRLSPAPLAAAKTAGVAVVMTVHDYGYVCHRKWMIDSRDRPCEAGFGARCLTKNCRSSKDGWAWTPYHGMRWLKTAVHRRVLKGCVDLFVCPSRHLSDWMRVNLGVDNVIHIPNYSSVDLSEPPPITETTRLLFAGRLTREKGVDVLLEALPVVRDTHPDVELTVAGDGPERPGLENLARRLGITDGVRFVGRVEAEQLGDHYRAAAICVLPTMWMENCPVAVLEAMAHGRPVVATRIGGVPELVDEGRTGLLFERGDHGQLAALLTGLVGDHARLADMGRRAWEKSRQDYPQARHVQRLVTVYRAAVDGRLAAIS